MAATSHDGLRAEVRELTENGETDVLIIGGGINGLATFRDLAMQGVRVVLVERGDFVSGASSASSHMIHGGIRYLENGEFRLVKEAVTERNALLRTAPHYVSPLRTTIPIFKFFSGILSAPARLLITHGRGKPSERGALLIKVGLVIYDTFSRGGGTVPRHRFRGRRRTRKLFPRMNSDVKYSASYFDASVHDPERLSLDVLHDGLEAGQGRARAANYVTAVGLDEGEVRVRDEVSGEEFGIRPKVVVNTSGPWTDITNTELGMSTTFMGGTKGSHIVLDNPELLAATRGNEIFFENRDGRIVLIYPLKDRVLVGTTDIDADPAEAVVCTDDEIQYFFDLIGEVYPDIDVTREQIVYTFAGIRPLPKHDDTAPGFVSRDYRIVRGEHDGLPVLSLVGGKWTTFRALAEHLSTTTMTELGRTHAVSTAGVSIGGGRDFPRDPQAQRDWARAHAGTHDVETALAMLRRYGTRAGEVLSALPADARPIPGTNGYYREELAHLAKTERVEHLLDLILRRTDLAFRGEVTGDVLAEAAAAVAGPLGWSAERVQGEIDETVATLRTAHLVEVKEVAGASS